MVLSGTIVVPCGIIVVQGGSNVWWMVTSNFVIDLNLILYIYIYAIAIDVGLQSLVHCRSHVHN